MEFDDAYRERLDSALERVQKSGSDCRALSRSERVEHVTQLLGLVHFLDAVERDLEAAPPEMVAVRATVVEAMTVLTERIRILAANQ